VALNGPVSPATNFWFEWNSGHIAVALLAKLVGQIPATEAAY
jgi:hypothetical protein